MVRIPPPPKSFNDPSVYFKEAMHNVGLYAQEPIIADGEIHRFFNKGDKSGSLNGWYVLSAQEDLSFGAFGHWVGDTRYSWHSKTSQTLSVAEKQAIDQKLKEAAQAREEEKQKKQAEAAREAQRIHSDLPDAPDEHPYLKAKNVKAHAGTKLARDGSFVVPLISSNNQITSLQYINPDGSKRFLKGGRIKGCYYPIGNPTEVLCICEGYATGASIYEVTGHAVMVAFNCGNLKDVAQALRKKYANLKIVICADNDADTKGNPGLVKAREASISINALLAIPPCSGDFNDLKTETDQMHTQDIKRIIDEAAPCKNPNSKAELLCMDDIEMVPIQWLWKERIALGKVTVIAGHPGLGKSQITAMLCAHVTAQISFPDGEHSELGDVVILSAEDDPADTIKPRLIAAGADLMRCHFLSGIKTKASGRDTVRLFDLSQDIDPLEDIIKANKNIKLLVIDPVSAYQGKTDSHNNADIRALLAPYSEMAAKYGVAVVLVTHFNKSSTQDPIERFIGSIGLVAAARAAYIVVKDEQTERKRYFLPVKNNIGNDSEGFAYDIQGIELNGGIKTSYVRWYEGIVEAQKILKPEKKTQTNGAKDFLSDLISEKPIMAKDVFDEADGMGYSKQSIQRAAKLCGIKKKKLGMEGGWLWYIEGQENQVTEIMNSSTSS